MKKGKITVFDEEKDKLSISLDKVNSMLQTTLFSLQIENLRFSDKQKLYICSCGICDRKIGFYCFDKKDVEMHYLYWGWTKTKKGLVCMYCRQELKES